MCFTLNPSEPNLNTNFLGGRRGTIYFMRYLRLKFESSQFGAGDANYSEPLLSHILAHFSKLQDAYQASEEEK